MKRNFLNILTFLLIALSATVTAFAQETLPELVKRIKPSAVAIETFNAKGDKLARGSGFFVAVDKIITNRHVIEGSSRVEIHLANGKKYTVKGVSAVDGEGDLALLQVQVPPEFAKPLPIDKATPQEGESIVVIGNPFGLEGSVSNGIVSAVREIAGYGKIIQITAPISPGSSGSPVVNMQGNVVGVATLQAEEGQSLNFAVPSARILLLKIGNIQTFAELEAELKSNKRKNAERLYAQGLAVLSRDDYTRAIPFFEKAAAIDNDYAEAWYQAGFCYGMLGKHAESLKATKQAARIRPDWAETFVNIGASSFALGQFKEAADAYRQAAKIDSFNPETQYALGLTLNKLNKPDEEILAYKRTIALKPDHTNAFEKLGLAYFKARRFNDALNAFEQFKIMKGDSKAFNYLGETLFELNKLDDAIENFNNSLSQNPDFGKARYNLGRTYLKQGNREYAQAQYDFLRNVGSDWADRLLVLLNP